MRLPVEGTSARKAQKAFDEIRLQYEREEEERLEREAKAKELAENTHPDALLPFTEYMEKWLQSTRSSLATATYQSYSNMIKARIRPYFAPLGLQLREVTPQHIENFYQSILADDCTTNTVIHYHAIIRKALQTAVKKDVLLKNPADKVDRPKKNVFHGSFYSEEEMLTLFDAVSGDPLELCVKIAAYRHLRPAPTALLEATPQNPVLQSAHFRQATFPPRRCRGRSTSPLFSAGKRIRRKGRCHGTAQIRRPNEVGAKDE